VKRRFKIRQPIARSGAGLAVNLGAQIIEKLKTAGGRNAGSFREKLGYLEIKQRTIRCLEKVEKGVKSDGSTVYLRGKEGHEDLDKMEGIIEVGATCDRKGGAVMFSKTKGAVEPGANPDIATTKRMGQKGRPHINRKFHEKALGKKAQGSTWARQVGKEAKSFCTRRSKSCAPPRAGTALESRLGGSDALLYRVENGGQGRTRQSLHRLGEKTVVGKEKKKGKCDSIKKVSPLGAVQKNSCLKGRGRVQFPMYNRESRTKEKGHRRGPVLTPPGPLEWTESVRKGRLTCRAR